jgi:hypothetical protein
VTGVLELDPVGSFMRGEILPSCEAKSFPAARPYAWLGVVLTQAGLPPQDWRPRSSEEYPKLPTERGTVRSTLLALHLVAFAAGILVSTTLAAGHARRRDEGLGPSQRTALF